MAHQNLQNPPPPAPPAGPAAPAQPRPRLHSRRSRQPRRSNWLSQLLNAIPRGLPRTIATGALVLLTFILALVVLGVPSRVVTSFRAKHANPDQRAEGVRFDANGFEIWGETSQSLERVEGRILGSATSGGILGIGKKPQSPGWIQTQVEATAAYDREMGRKIHDLNCLREQNRHGEETLKIERGMFVSTGSRTITIENVDPQGFTVTVAGVEIPAGTSYAICVPAGEHTVELSWSNDVKEQLSVNCSNRDRRIRAHLS